MNNLVTLRDFLKEYGISKNDFLAETQKDKDFYDQYIEWEDRDDATIIEPKALERLGKMFEKASKSSDSNNTKSNKKSKMADYMEQPSEEQSPSAEKPKETKLKTVRKRKTKMNITRQFLQEHGHCDSNGNFEPKSLRKFLINSGLYKVEQVAIMSDTEVMDAIKKDYYFISSAEGLYIIKRSALASIMSDVFVIEE